MSVQTNISSAVETFEGDGAQVNRLFPIRKGFMNYDPFVLWDHFELTSGSGFPEHPHRGFEAITYMFDGSIEHKDNLNNKSTVYAGGAQRFTAGRGIVHSEMPAQDAYSKGIQVWINLPRHLKKIAPSYQQVDAHELSEEIVNGVRVRTIVGSKNSIQLNTPVQYLDVFFEQQTQYQADIPFAHRGFIYVVKGAIHVNDAKMKKGDAYFFEQRTPGLTINGNQKARLMMISGIPHKQPIIQHGPYVD